LVQARNSRIDGIDLFVSPRTFAMVRDRDYFREERLEAVNKLTAVIEPTINVCTVREDYEVMLWKRRQLMQSWMD
jgi:hypothetical protein